MLSPTAMLAVTWLVSSCSPDRCLIELLLRLACMVLPTC